MNKELEEAKKEYLETLNRRGEIEFDFDGFHYHIESTDYEHDDFDVWKFTAHGSDDGVIFAHCKNAKEVLSAKIFNGKNLLEIDNEIINCYLS